MKFCEPFLRFAVLKSKHRVAQWLRVLYPEDRPGPWLRRDQPGWHVVEEHSAAELDKLYADQ